MSKQTVFYYKDFANTNHGLSGTKSNHVWVSYLSSHTDKAFILKAELHIQNTVAQTFNITVSQVYSLPNQMPLSKEYSFFRTLVPL